jgi:hypothetical protein
VLQAPPAFFAAFPAAGIEFTVCWPAGLAGTSALLQTVVVDPAAQNGLYASSLGIELQGI